MCRFRVDYYFKRSIQRVRSSESVYMRMCESMFMTQARYVDLAAAAVDTIVLRKRRFLNPRSVSSRNRSRTRACYRLHLDWCRSARIVAPISYGEFPQSAELCFDVSVQGLYHVDYVGPIINTHETRAPVSSAYEKPSTLKTPGGGLVSYDIGFIGFGVIVIVLIGYGNCHESYQVSDLIAFQLSLDNGRNGKGKSLSSTELHKLLHQANNMVDSDAEHFSLVQPALDFVTDFSKAA
jgi:hypothetical protein